MVLAATWNDRKNTLLRGSPFLLSLRIYKSFFLDNACKYDYERGIQDGGSLGYECRSGLMNNALIIQAQEKRSNKSSSECSAQHRLFRKGFAAHYT